MAANDRRMLALGLRGKLLCCLFFRGKTLDDWRATRKGAVSPDQAVAVLQGWLATYQPDCIVLENADSVQRKGARKRAILRALDAAADDFGALKLAVVRKQTYKNMYEEAAALAAQFPELAPWLPSKPPIWSSEHRHTAYFEALSMAVQVLDA